MTERVIGSHILNRRHYTRQVVARFGLRMGPQCWIVPDTCEFLSASQK